MCRALQGPAAWRRGLARRRHSGLRRATQPPAQHYPALIYTSATCPVMPLPALSLSQRRQERHRPHAGSQGPAPPPGTAATMRAEGQPRPGTAGSRHTPCHPSHTATTGRRSAPHGSRAHTRLVTCGLQGARRAGRAGAGPPAWRNEGADSQKRRHVNTLKRIDGLGAIGRGPQGKNRHGRTGRDTARSWQQRLLYRLQQQAHGRLVGNHEGAQGAFSSGRRQVLSGALHQRQALGGRQRVLDGRGGAGH